MTKGSLQVDPCRCSPMRNLRDTMRASRNARAFQISSVSCISFASMDPYLDMVYRYTLSLAFTVSNVVPLFVMWHNLLIGVLAIPFRSSFLGTLFLEYWEDFSTHSIARPAKFSTPLLLLEGRVPSS